MVKEAVRALRRLGYIVHADVVVTFQGEKPERSFQNFGATLVFDNLIFFWGSWHFETPFWCSKILFLMTSYVNIQFENNP
jgi:hypothetical protein